MSLSASPTISPATSSIFSKFTLILIKSVEAVSVFVTPPSSWWVSVSLRLWWWVVGIAALVTYVRWGLADSLNHTSHVKGGWNWFFFNQVTLWYEKAVSHHKKSSSFPGRSCLTVQGMVPRSEWFPSMGPARARARACQPVQRRLRPHLPSLPTFPLSLHFSLTGAKRNRCKTRPAQRPMHNTSVSQNCKGLLRTYSAHFGF